MNLRSEKLLFRPNTSGAVSVCLAYPNTYAVGMGNLGFQAVHRILATTPGVVCERLFLDESSSSERTEESGRGPAEFDILAFSLSFEADYPNIVRMLDRAGIPARAEARASAERGWPLLLAGGPATFLNPEPVAPFFDAFLLGEGEEMLVEAFADAESWQGAGRDAILETLGSVRGAYLPHLYSPVYEDGDLVDLERRGGAPEKVERRYVADLDQAATKTAIVAPDSVFGDSFLVEASRGCEWGCRFCAAGFMYRPVRHRSHEGVMTDALAGLEEARTIGLVGAEMASHPGIAQTCQRIADAGGRASPSSLKADRVTKALAAAMVSGGTRSATVAPEAGSARMRRVINKNLTETEILRAADWLVGDGVESLKLYFLCGLPTEEQADIDAIHDLTAEIRERMVGHGRKRGRVGHVKVSLNPFVPKPWTPFQWDAMAPVAETQRKIAGLRGRLGKLANVDMDAESPREAYLQTLLSRGDRRVADIVEALARGGGPDAGAGNGSGWWQLLRAMNKDRGADATVAPELFVTREYAADALLPWDFIDQHIDKAYLWRERTAALSERETGPCDVSSCTTCGAC